MIAPDLETGIRHLRQMVDEAATVVPFTGAGISTECGIPDFRSPGGIWTKMQPIEFKDYLSDPDARRVSWQRRLEMEETWNTVTPNAGHLAVAQMVARGKASHVITQNIDGLHQQSGVPDERLVELHGSTRYAKCLDCGLRMEIADLKPESPEAVAMEQRLRDNEANIPAHLSSGEQP